MPEPTTKTMSTKKPVAKKTAAKAKDLKPKKDAKGGMQLRSKRAEIER
jgi:hypothetical protein